MQKKSKTIFTAVVTVLFVLSVSYFALLAPTTAWYYQEDTTSRNYSFTFGDFKMEEEARVDDLTVPLRAATRFADAGEVLFDEVAHIVKVDAENHGGVKGQVVVNVQPDDNNPAGLKWFIYDTAQNTASVTDNEISDVTAGTTATKGAYKIAIETMLTQHGVTPLDYKNQTAINALSGASYDAKYETYNATAVAALNAHNAQKILFNPGEEKVIYVVFWAEYGEVESSLDVSSAVTLGNYSVDIDFEAGPYMPEYQTLSITNTYSGDINMRLYLDGSTTQYTGLYKVGSGSTMQEYSASGGLIGGIAGQTVEVQIEVGTPFKLTIASTGFPVHFENASGGIGTVSGVSGKVITDTISNLGNRINIVQDAAQPQEP